MPSSKIKDPSILPDSLPRPVTVRGGNVFGDKVVVAAHQHRKAQLIYMARGVLTCEVSQGLWIVAPGSALWIPGGETHSTRGDGPIEVYCVFVDQSAAPHMPNHCCTLSISPLIRELILQCSEIPVLIPDDGPESRLLAVLLDGLAAAPVEKLHLPMPPNECLRQIADAMIADPADRSDLDDWAERIGVSRRTLSRLSLQETGMSFGRWRQQLHISLALQWLSQGHSVQAVATDLGYESSSSFVYMFRKALGSSPARYMAQRLAHSAGAGPASDRTGTSTP